MRRPTLFLTVGLPCTGKTTAARHIEIEQNALRLTKDEWVKALYGHENPPSAQDVIEGRLIHIGLRALELGNDVVIDYGLWSRDERGDEDHPRHHRGGLAPPATEHHDTDGRSGSFGQEPAEQRAATGLEPTPARMKP